MDSSADTGGTSYDLNGFTPDGNDADYSRSQFSFFKL
jgi:hypothetical protein